MGFFQGLGSKISNGVRSIGSKLADGAQWLGGKVGAVGDTVADLAAKAAPIISTISPELGATAAAVASGAKAASTLGKDVNQGLQDYRNGNRNLANP